jgi:ABC-type phosphate transport system substrate-binding protein
VRSSRGVFIRLGIYTLAVVALLFLRVIPGLRGQRVTNPIRPVDATLTIAGTALAPELINRLVGHYTEMYPKTRFELRGGTTRQSLQDLVNGEVDVALLCREPSTAEMAAIRGAGDSTLTFPMALGAIAVLASGASGIDSLSMQQLRALVGAPATPGSPVQRLYVPEPNTGLWEVLAARLDVPAEGAAGVIWLASDSAVVDAVARDLQSVGVASTLAVPDALELRGVRALTIVDEDRRARATDVRGLASGDYALPHLLYLACRPMADPVAAGFVTYFWSGRGQRFISHEGYLPAREVAREIQLVREPWGGKS